MNQRGSEPKGDSLDAATADPVASDFLLKSLKRLHLTTPKKKALSDPNTVHIIFVSN